jgi:hypothetical protein
MRVTRSADGVRIRLNLAESHVLEQLFQELQGILEPGGLGRSDPVQRRLYPAAYDDAEQAQAFRDLTETALRQERSERVDECLGELRRSRSLVRTDVHLDAMATERWLRVLNDLRLSFGTRLGITEDDDNAMDETDPQIGLRARYLWLTALQDVLVTTVMG